MRQLVFLSSFVAILTMLFATGCTEKRSEDADMIVDTLRHDTMEIDTVADIAEETPMPKSADELFDDFVFNFAGNQKLQRQRIQFPLSVEKDGAVSRIERKDWTFEAFFMNQGFYTLVVSNYDELEAAKDTKVEDVTIEKVQIPSSCVRQHVFRRVSGLWKMEMIKDISIESHPNGDFYSFCDHFLRDSTYRMAHMAENVEFSGPDPDDDFMRIEGFIMPEQLAMFAPELPSGHIYNIIYGDVMPHGDKRILVIRGIANGFEMELTFRKKESGYILVKLVV